MTQALCSLNTFACFYSMHASRCCLSEYSNNGNRIMIMLVTVIIISESCMYNIMCMDIIICAYMPLLKLMLIRLLIGM